MNSNSDDSVYNLIKKLCATFSNDQIIIKKLFILAYGILLGKEQTQVIKKQNSKSLNAYCNLLAWSYVLSTRHALLKESKRLEELGEELVKASYGEEILNFLLYFRNVPKGDDFDEFQISDNLKYLYSRCDLTENAVSVHLNHEETASSLNVWELSLNQPCLEQRTWENFGLYGFAAEAKEKPFLSELGIKSHVWVESLPSVYLSSLTLDNRRVKPEVKTLQEFIKDLKYLLVGVASFSFNADSTGKFFLIPNLSIKGIAPSTLKDFSTDFIFDGTCYKSLSDISARNSQTGEYKQKGYIFAEFCQSIQRYLEYYRTAIFAIPDDIGLLKLHDRTRQLSKHLTTLTAICKLGPYSEAHGMPNGVSLLNYLYQTILSITDNNTLLVLYAILFPCCQVYFNRFIQQWFLEGIIHDPWNEFFVCPNYQYTNIRGRMFWTRNFSVRENIVPEFLVDLRMDILNCGKAMNLLKSCMPSNKLCSYLRGKKPLIISCCLTSEQLTVLEQNTTSYYFEILLECGPGVNFEQLMKKHKEQDPIFMELIAQKRAATLKRLALEKKKAAEEEKEKKNEEFLQLKEQYDAAVKLKEENIAAEIEREMRQIEYHMAVENVRAKLIEREAWELVNYYEELHEISNKRKIKIDNHIDRLKGYTFEAPLSPEISFCEDVSNLGGDTAMKEDQLTRSAEDILNANKEKLEFVEVAEDLLNANKAKLEDTTYQEKKNCEELIKPMVAPLQLTEAQRNKLKVLGSEFGIDIAPQALITKKTLTQGEINRNLVMQSSDCFKYDKLDNENFVNKNIPNTKIGKTEKPSKKILSLEILKPELPTPMSVDSTPASDSTISRIPSNIDSIPTTSEIPATDEGFIFEEPSESKYIPIKRSFSSSFQQNMFSKRVTREEASGLSTNCLKLFLHESISIPLTTQLKLVDNELLKYFVNDLHYLEHLNSLRDYFFLQDGEISRHLTENLFEKLYDVQCPTDLLNCKTLRNLVCDAIEASGKMQEQSACLSFKINSVPTRFHLGDPDVLDCLSLTYRVDWPLNIVLPIDTIAKYNEVFKYLLKISRISWVLKKIFMELKMLAQLSGKKEIYLMTSPQYRRLHQCRHVMLHFVQTLQNYMVGEVLQSSWSTFEQNLSTVYNLDSLYETHTAYIKNILFLSFLNQKAAPLRKIVQKIFVVILKFYDHLRSRSWKFEDGVYVHPSFVKLNSIFLNFEEFVLYFEKLGRKVAESGYQPHISQLLDLLDLSGYYSKKRITKNV